MAKTSVPKFSSKTLDFISKASRQKNPNWLEKHRAEYEALLLEPLQHLAKSLKAQLASDAPGYHFPLKGIGRLKRSANRAEEYGSYFRDWVHYSAAKPRTSRFDHHPNIYLLIQPEEEDGDHVLIAGGLYMPSSRQLRQIREAIAQDASPFEHLFSSKAFSARFKGGFCKEKIATRPPRGFDPNHPKIETLKLQAFFVWRSYSMREFSSAEFSSLVAKDARQILKLNALLEQALDPAFRAKVAAPKKRPKNEDLMTRLEGLDEAPRRQMDF